jgi:hypothetical protein
MTAAAPRLLYYLRATRLNANFTIHLLLPELISRCYRMFPKNNVGGEIARIKRRRDATTPQVRSHPRLLGGEITLDADLVDREICLYL